MTNQGKSVARRTEAEPSLDVTDHGSARIVSPLADVLETSDAYLVMLDMPGVAKDGISVTMEGESLTVRGSTETVQKEETELVFSEIRSGTYLRQFTLGRDVDRENIDATYEQGVLTVRLSKMESVKQREIVVR